MALSESTRLKPVLAYASGTTDRNSSSVDMVGFGGVAFAVHFGTVAAGQDGTLKLQGSADDSAWQDVENSGRAFDTDDSDAVVLLDEMHPRFRYLRCVVDKDGSNASAESIVAYQYEAHSEPVTHDEYVSAGLNHGSAAGTA